LANSYDVIVVGAGNAALSAAMAAKENCDSVLVVEKAPEFFRGGNTYFNNDVDSLFCYTRLENFGGKQEVSHVWYYENKLIDRINYNIKSLNIYRSWTRKTILKTQVGAWRVDIEDSANNVVDSKSFFII